MIRPAPISHVPSGTCSSGTSQMPPIMMRNSPQPMLSSRLLSATFCASWMLEGWSFCAVMVFLQERLKNPALHWASVSQVIVLFMSIAARATTHLRVRRYLVQGHLARHLLPGAPSPKSGTESCCSYSYPPANQYRIDIGPCLWNG